MRCVFQIHRLQTHKPSVGSATPSITDNTDFGNVTTTRTVTYTIQNIGNANLTVFSIDVSETHASEFVVSNFTPNTTISGGSAITFDVTFTSATTGTRTATLTITNDDADEATYNFALQATKVTPPPPPAPLVPVNANLSLSATAVSDTQIDLTWTTNADATAYRLYRGTTLINTFSAQVARYSDINLTSNTRYQYKLIAVIDNRDSAPSLATEWTLPQKPTVDSVAILCQNGEAFVALSSEEQNYKVYKEEEGGNPILESTTHSFTLPFVDIDSAFYVSTINLNSEKESKRTKVNVIIQPAFEANILGEDIEISCVDSLLLKAQPLENATYTWLLNGYEIGTGEEFMAKYAGNYQVRIQKGVCSFTSDSTKVLLRQTPLAKIRERDGVRFCGNGTLTALTTQNENLNASYEWFVNGVALGQNTTLEVTQSGTYTLLVKTETCESSTEIAVVITESPLVPVLVTSQDSICKNGEVTLSVQNQENGVTYRWKRNGRVINQTGSSLTTTSIGKYQVEVLSSSNTACKTISNEIQINRFADFVVYLRENQDGKSLFLEAINFQTIQGVEWYFEGELNTDLGTTSEIIPTQNGYYSARVTNQNGCIFQTRTVYFSINTDDDDIITGEEDLQKDTFKIYPNPNNGSFKVHFGTVLLENTEVTIFDGIGRKIYATTFEKGTQDFTLHLKDQAKGMYLIHFNQNGATYSKSVIIE